MRYITVLQSLIRVHVYVVHVAITTINFAKALILNLQWYAEMLQSGDIHNLHVTYNGD